MQNAAYLMTGDATRLIGETNLIKYSRINSRLMLLLISIPLWVMSTFYDSQFTFMTGSSRYFLRGPPLLPIRFHDKSTS